MEAPELLLGGCYRGGSRQFGTEKQGKAGEAFAVEDLLDFSNDDDGLCCGGGDGGLGFETAADEYSTLTALDSSSNSSSGCGDQHFSGDQSCPSFSDGLSVPYDEIAELEWLSNIVWESFSGEDLQRLQLISGVVKPSSPASASRAPTGGAPAQGAAPSAQSGAALFGTETHVPGKARSKRSRPAPSSWSSRLLVLSPTSSSSESDAVSISPLLNSNTLSRKSPKLEKKESAAAAAAAAAAEGPAPASDGRKCQHCATDKTPQWRTGPMGPKTLCNACGVRYKSGRLVPEYRPAASPTFVPSKHSNSHRKVVELRRQKEVQPHGGAPFLHPSSVYDPAPPSVDDLLLHHNMGPDFRQLI